MFVAGGGLPPLLACLVDSGSKDVQAAAAALLANLMCDACDPVYGVVRQAVAGCTPAIPTFVRLLNSREPAYQEAAAQVSRRTPVCGLPALRVAQPCGLFFI